MAKKKNKHKQHPNHSQKGKEVNWDLVWKVLASVFAFAGSVATVYDLVDKVRSDVQTFYSFILPGLAIIVWVIVLAQLFRKKNPYAVLLLAVTVLGGVGGGIGWRSYNQTQEDKVIVLVAQFDGPEETYGLRRQMMEDLRESTKGYDDTIIIEGNEIVTSSEYARELGAKEKADLVIWAWYRPTEDPNITIHIENLSPTELVTLQESETYKPQATLTQLKSFDVQRQLGSETSTLISYLVGVLRLESGDYKLAIERFEKVLEEDDISTFVSKYSLHFNIGYSNMQLGNYELAILGFDKAIETNPMLMESYLNRGIAYGILREYDRSIQDFNKAIEISPQWAGIYSNRGNAYMYLDDYDRAVQDYSKAVEIDPQFGSAYSNRGIVYMLQGEYSRAIQEYDRAIQIDPRDSVSFYNRGLSYLSLEDIEQAIQDYSKAIESNPHFSEAYNNRGVAYGIQGRDAWAIQDFNKAIEINPQNKQAYNNRGYAFNNLKQYDKAILDCNKAIAIDPRYATPYQVRGLAYQALGKYAEAESDFKKYEELTGQKP